MNEFELIHRLTRSLPVSPDTIVGVGDDCAVVDAGIPGRWLLLKTDAVVEGVHFTREADGPKVGHKAMARCLSDVAAMAGTPTHALVSLGLPRDFDAAYVESIYSGLARTAAAYGVGIVGGETTASAAHHWISVALVGTVSRTGCIRRAGARPGDAIFVTGELGGSLAGRHLEFEPRIREARWLAERFELHSMIDLSDGLAGDLPHLLKAGGVGAELLADAIPISRAAKEVARRGSAARPPLLAALTDGEDFELLFTLPSRQAVPLLDDWKREFASLPLSCVGKITAEPGVRLRDSRGLRPMPAHGYVHFAES